MLNYITKLFFTVSTYTYNLANAMSPKCLELTNFPWVKLYMFQGRFTIIAQIATFMCMSFAKVLLSWQPSLFIKLNSRSTVNIATIFVIFVILADILMRVDMHVIRQCEEKLLIKVYETEFNRQLCIPEGYDTTNLTVCKIYDIAENVYPIGCKVCKPTIPMVSIMILLVLLLETAKFTFGFIRNFKHFTKIFSQRNTKVNVETNNQINNRNSNRQTFVEDKQITSRRIILVKEYIPTQTTQGTLKIDSPTTLQSSFSDSESSRNNKRIFDILNIDTNCEGTSLSRGLSLPNINMNIEMDKLETESDTVLDDTKENSR